MNSEVRRAALDLAGRLSMARHRIMTQNEFRCHDVSEGLLELETFNDHMNEDPGFGYSLRSFLLYAQLGDANYRQAGLFLERRDASFALGLFAKDAMIHAHIVSPRGENWGSRVSAFSKWLLNNSLVDRVYVRHLAPSDAAALSGFESINECNAWVSGAPLEDETFNHRVVSLNCLVGFNEDGSLCVNNIQGDGSGNFRSKFRLAFQRCRNFLNRNHLSFSLRALRTEDLSSVRLLVEDHFATLERAGKALGSTALDYERLLATHLGDDERLLSVVGVLSHGDREIIASVFLGERTGPFRGGLYCSITNRSPQYFRTIFREEPDLTGLTALPQYALACVFGLMTKRGWLEVDLGGSETQELDRFKRQMGAKRLDTTWMVRTSETSF
jgi:hypothetical protein